MEIRRYLGGKGTSASVPNPEHEISVPRPGLLVYFVQAWEVRCEETVGVGADDWPNSWCDAQTLCPVARNSQQANDIGSGLPRLCPIARARSFTPAAEAKADCRLKAKSKDSNVQHCQQL